MSNGKTDGRGIDCKAASLTQSMHRGTMPVRAPVNGGSGVVAPDRARGPNRGLGADRLGSVALQGGLARPPKAGWEIAVPE